MSDTGPRRDRLLLDVLVVACLCALVGLCSFRLREIYPDDALIVLRYARHLLDGHGWVYNVGEAVNATTSPLHVMVVVGLAGITGDLLTAQPLAFALPLAAATIMAFVQFRHLGRLPATMAGVLVALTPRVYTTLGMESSLLIACALGACVANENARPRLAGLLAGAAVLARPDAALLGGILTLRAWRSQGWRAALGLALGAGLVVLPWVWFATARFGSPLPNTLAVKLAQRHFFKDPPIFLNGAWRELRWLDERAVGVPPWAVLAVALGATACLAWHARRHRASACFAAFAWLQFATYAVFDLPPYHWYYAPVFGAVALALATTFATTWATQRPLPMLAGIIVTAASLAVALPELVAPQPSRPNYPLAGVWFAEHTPPDCTIAVADIGIVGFHAYPRRILDMQGLVTAGAAEAIARGDTGWWFDRERPDYVLAHTVPWPDFEVPVLSRPDFLRTYRRLPGTHLRGLEVWERVARD
ncbi:MAG: hypothetical protein R3F56_14380 [Planctomycetota bacterium]